MSNLSFLNFQYGVSRKPSLKPAQRPSISKERQRSSKSMSSSGNFQANVEELRWVFNKYDTNKDGKISQEEYKFATMGNGLADQHGGVLVPSGRYVQLQMGCPTIEGHTNSLNPLQQFL
ncbi:calmodulin-like protein 30 [Quercus suber]|uniref:Calmodulin-like protein 30 n=1 Tax=Quercus suber TaxID=58331 RepID=A0AAW0M0Z6_QUESU